MANATRTEGGSGEFIGLSFPAEAVPSSSLFKDGIELAKDERPDTAKPTAALLLSRFLNSAFVDASSPGYKAALEEAQRRTASSSSSSPDNVDEHDSDMDDEALDRDEPSSATSSEPQTAEPTTKDGEYYDPYQHVAAVIMNIAQLNTGRDFLMRLIHISSDSKQKKKGATAMDSIQEDDDTGNGKETETTTSHLQSLLPQMESPNPRRRQGIAGTLKNC